MHKKITEMTDADKQNFLEQVKLAMIIEQGVPWGRAAGKTAAKKKAAFMVLARLLETAGICEPVWREQMLRNIMC